MQSGEEHASSGTLPAPSPSLNHFSMDGSGRGEVTYLSSKLGLQTRQLRNVTILSGPSLPSGIICSARPLHAECYQHRHPRVGDICGYHCLELGFS